MSQHVIVGAGPVGSATALALAERGEKVLMVTRSGGGPEHEGIERVGANAADADTLATLAKGAVALYNCANPQYHQWFIDWPPLAEALLSAAERSGAVLVTAAPLYGYGEVSAPMNEDTPLAATHPKLRLRADMFRAALARHEAGRIRMTEVRASDYIEANGVLSWGMGAPLLAGKRAFVPIPKHVKHSYTSTVDTGRLLARVATDERAWGKAWMVPTHEPMTLAELADAFTKANGAPEPKVISLPYAALWAAGLFDPIVRELRATRYQFTKPFILDSARTEATFDLRARPLAESLREAAANVRKAASA